MNLVSNTVIVVAMVILGLWMLDVPAAADPLHRWVIRPIGVGIILYAGKLMKDWA